MMQNQRRGHKYKHSSVSHQIFLEPPPRAPLALPASLPIPTFTEWRKSISKEQNARILWCLGHCIISTYIWWCTGGSLAMTALSHLVLFDALSAILCVCVDVLGNFEVWKRSSLRHPFGLERAEVLAGFAMSVFLLFMGMDIFSHTAEHLLENWTPESELELASHSAHPVDHTDHSAHARVSPGSVDLAALLAIISTLTSAIVLRNHARIGQAMRFNTLESLKLPGLLSNPAHMLTLGCAGVLLILPLLSIGMFSWLDRCLALGMALSMIVIGIRLVKVLGSMLLMSYGGPGVAEVIKEIELDSSVTSVQEASFWQVHHNLCMANLKLCARGISGAGGESRLRERITRLVRDRLGGPYGKRGQKWEVSIAIELDQ
ncbi:hypothetical protein BJ508DRAFT_124638 [Ascobolus immersus RN42]|uniref:Zinc transporter n=1 Tax=Ascobolus immersus RN42 TaxID=1160509 RepID=A0A3N4IGA4_ASCIM|nr:hypothetical protein BJ508DRAFT_124638 [Ascobolus immersus RN42]